MSFKLQDYMKWDPHCEKPPPPLNSYNTIFDYVYYTIDETPLKSIAKNCNSIDDINEFIKINKMNAKKLKNKVESKLHKVGFEEDYEDYEVYIVLDDEGWLDSLEYYYYAKIIDKYFELYPSFFSNCEHFIKSSV